MESSPDCSSEAGAETHIASIPTAKRIGPICILNALFISYSFFSRPLPILIDYLFVLLPKIKANPGKLFTTEPRTRQTTMRVTRIIFCSLRCSIERFTPFKPLGEKWLQGSIRFKEVKQIIAEPEKRKVN